jgi:hypothetical protein
MPQTQETVIQKSSSYKKRKQSPFNQEKYDYVLYEDLAQLLEDLALRSDRIHLSITGKSSKGLDLYTVTITENKAVKDEKYSLLRSFINDDPVKAQEWLKENDDVKVPIIIHASLHGTEFVGTDAVLQLIEWLGFSEQEEVKELLRHFIVIFNVNANPDGRVEATRYNGSGLDLNRDFVTQSQPETKAVVKQIVHWHPLIFLDLHGYVKQFGAEYFPGLILPGTPPHNPNYQYDLLYKWMLPQADAMEQTLVNERHLYSGELYKTMKGTHIPLRDSKNGWDLYPPIYTPAYAMLHGAYSYTLEAPTNDEDGVRWLVNATVGALTYTLQNKQKMLHDQLEIFVRGVTGDHPNQLLNDIPKAYILPLNSKDSSVIYQTINQLLENGIKVQQSTAPFVVDGQDYQQNSFIVPTNQSKAGLIHAWLSLGYDITTTVEKMYDIAAWSLPALWGFQAIPVGKIDAPVEDVGQIRKEVSVNGKGPFIIRNTSVEAIKLVNFLLEQEIPILRDQQGDFYVNISKTILYPVVSGTSLQIDSQEIPGDVTRVKKKNIAIFRDAGYKKAKSHAGVKLALEDLGFSVLEVDVQNVIQNGLTNVDTFVFSGNEALLTVIDEERNAAFGLKDEEELLRFKERIHEFLHRQGHFIGIGSGAAKVAKNLDITTVEVHTANSTSNGIVKVNYNSYPLSWGYGQEEYGFVYGPVWYTETKECDVIARFKDEEDFFVAGHWSNREVAKGKAVFITERSLPVTLIGLEAGFRNHPKHLYRLVSNSIFYRDILKVDREV